MGQQPWLLLFLFSVFVFVNQSLGQPYTGNCDVPYPVSCGGFCWSNQYECATWYRNNSMSQNSYCVNEGINRYDGDINCPRSACNPGQVNCWDGSCVLADKVADLCPPIPRCPLTLTRCPDGTCASDVSKCPKPKGGSCNGTLCLTGTGEEVCLTSNSTANSTSANSPPPCPHPFYGCPVLSGSLCATGDCATNVSRCSDYCPSSAGVGTLYLCWELRCYRSLSSCPTPGFLWYYPSFSQVIYGGKNNTNITVRSNSPTEGVLNEKSNLPLFQLILPGGMFTNGSRNVITFAPVIESELKLISPSKNWVQNKGVSQYYFNLYSPPARIWFNTSNVISPDSRLNISFRVTPLTRDVNPNEFCLGIVKNNEWSCLTTTTGVNMTFYDLVPNGTVQEMYSSLVFVRDVTNAKPSLIVAVIRNNSFPVPARVYETAGGGVFFGLYILFAILLVVALAFRKPGK